MSKNDYLKEGFRFFAQQDYSSAEVQFKKALELDPEFDLALNALCETYNKSGKLDAAMKIAQQLVNQSPQDPLTHAVLSRIYMQKGMIQEAEDELAISTNLSSGS